MVDQAEKTSDYDDQLFDVRRSVRYHQHRCRFYDNFHDIVTAFTVILGLSSVGTFIINYEKLAIASAMLISVLGIFDLVIGTTRKARSHNELANRFIQLEKAMVRSDPLSLEKVINHRLTIEQDEPPKLSVLDVICYNELMRSMGYRQDQMAKIGFFQRLFAQFFDFQAHSIQNPHESKL